jgi:hypothetical protein
MHLSFGEINKCVVVKVRRGEMVDQSGEPITHSFDLPDHLKRPLDAAFPNNLSVFLPMCLS